MDGIKVDFWSLIKFGIEASSLRRRLCRLMLLKSVRPQASFLSPFLLFLSPSDPQGHLLLCRSSSVLKRHRVSDT